MITLRSVVAASAVGLLAVGCAGPGGQDNAPFRGTRPAPAGNFVSGEVVIGGIYDIGGVLQNYSSARVRLTSLRLISPAGPGIRVLNVRAYLISQLGAVGVIDEGNLPKDCPERYKPHPVTDVAVAPRSFSRWEIVIAVVFRKPGKYHFGLLRLGPFYCHKSG